MQLPFIDQTLLGNKSHRPSKTIFVSRQTMRLTQQIAEEYRQDPSSLFQGGAPVSSEPHQIVLTSHCLPTVVELCSALKKVCDQIVFFPIPYSIEEDSLEKIQAMGIKTFVEEGLDSHLNRVREFLESSEISSYLIECGGYLPLLWGKLSPEARKKVKGAVEDTERGLRNYERIEGELPVFDVARSVCKRFEDAIVGDSVIHSVAHILRSADLPLVGMVATVIGFGKIGQSCARSLAGFRSRVRVFDSDAHKMLEALNLGYSIEERERSFRGSRLVVGATGENSLKREDLSLLDDQTILASGSSRQIEFFDLLKAADEVQEIGSHLSSYSFRQDNKTLFVVNDGYPANFIHGSSMGSRIDLVLASLLVSYLHLLHHRGTCSNAIVQLPQWQQQHLAKKWLHIWNYGKDYSMEISL